MSAEADHERIWLQSAEDADHFEGRLWCQDKVWPEHTEDHEPTEYVRADLYASTQAEILRLKAALAECRTFVIACRAEAKGRNNNRYEHASSLLETIDAARSLSHDGEEGL